MHKLLERIMLDAAISYGVVLCGAAVAMAITAVRALASETNFILFPVKNVVVLYVLVLREKINVVLKSRMSCIEGR